MPRLGAMPMVVLVMTPLRILFGPSTSVPLPIADAGAFCARGPLLRFCPLAARFVFATSLPSAVSAACRSESAAADGEEDDDDDFAAPVF